MDKVTNDPYATGKEILEKLLEEDKLSDSEKRKLNLTFLNEFQEYEFSQSKLLCKKTIEGCYLTNDDSVDLSANLLEEHGNYIDKYFNFLKYSHFKEITSYKYESPLPSYRTIIDSQKLYHLSLINSKLTSQNLVDEIHNEISLIKTKLIQSDTILPKMVMVALIAESIEFINLLVQNSVLDPKKVDLNKLALPLSLKEMNMEYAYYNENSKNLRNLYEWVTDIEKLVDQDFKPQTIPLLRIIYFFIAKPNLTVNTIYQQGISKLLQYIKLPMLQFYCSITLVKTMHFSARL